MGGNLYFFCDNLYQSLSFIDASMYCDIFHAIRIAMQFAKNSRRCVMKIDSQRQRLGAPEPKIDLVETGALCHMARQSDYASDIGPRSIVLHPREVKSPVFQKFNG